MTKRIVAKIATRTDGILAAWAGRATESCARIFPLVWSFWLQNPTTQFGQNAKRDAVSSVIKIAGIATPFAFTYAPQFEVVLNPDTGKRGKEEVATFFSYLSNRMFANPNAVLTMTGSIMTWCARKIVGGRSRSVECAMMFATLCLLEESGATIESLTVGPNTFARDTIMARGASQLADYEDSKRRNVLHIPERLTKKNRVREGVTFG